MAEIENETEDRKIEEQLVSEQVQEHVEDHELEPQECSLESLSIPLDLSAIVPNESHEVIVDLKRSISPTRSRKIPNLSISISHDQNNENEEEGKKERSSSAGKLRPMTKKEIEIAKFIFSFFSPSFNSYF